MCESLKLHCIYFTFIRSEITRLLLSVTNACLVVTLDQDKNCNAETNFRLLQPGSLGHCNCSRGVVLQIMVLRHGAS